MGGGLRPRRSSKRKRISPLRRRETAIGTAPLKGRLPVDRERSMGAWRRAMVLSGLDRDGCNKIVPCPKENVKGVTREFWGRHDIGP